MNRFVSRALLAALALLAAACSSDPANFYVLNATATATSAPTTLSVAVGPVSVPAAVDRQQIVVTTSANQVTFDEFNRWASPLQDNIARVVADDLAALLGTSRVSLFPQSGDADADYRVRIEIRSFESAPGKSASLSAIWTVRRTKDGKSESGRTSVSEQVPDGGYGALAGAHSRSIERMSRDIADAVRLLDRGAPR